MSPKFLLLFFATLAVVSAVCGAAIDAESEAGEEHQLAKRNLADIKAKVSGLMKKAKGALAGMVNKLKNCVAQVHILNLLKTEGKNVFTCVTGHLDKGVSGNALANDLKSCAAQELPGPAKAAAKTLLNCLGVKV